MDSLGCRRGMATSYVASKRNIRLSCCAFKKHSSTCSPPSSSGENDDAEFQGRGKSMKRYLLLAVILLSCLGVFGETKPAADLIIQNALIWTVDPSQPEAQSVAVLGERIVAVGSTQQIDVWRGPHTRVVDARGKRLLPGFNDAHIHFVDRGLPL